MSPIVARTHRLRRLIATLALALITATAVNAATGAPASAAPAAPAPNASFTWVSAALTTDRGTPCVPDPGDTVTLTYEVAVSPNAPGNLNWLMLASSGYFSVEGPEALAPGSSRTYTTDVMVTRPMLNALGSGPILAGGTFTYWMTNNGWPASFDVPAPPVAYTAPTPIAVSTTFLMTEIHGVIGDNKLVEGDRVSEVTHVTNTSAVTLRVTGPASSTPAGAVSLAAGATRDFVGTSVQVTYADMVAGAVTFADASVSWSVRTLSGTVAAPVGTVPTEAINATADASATFTVHSAADGTTVPVGAAVVGDTIDVKVDVTNKGNVTLNYIGFTLNPWTVGITMKSNDASLLTPGTSLPNGIWKPKDINSAKGEIARYVLAASDIARGYVDVGADINAAPSRAVYDASPANYTTRADERVFLKDFTTNADLSFTQAELNDTNGDGIGQAGETVTYRVGLTNNADQDLVIDNAFDAKGSDIASPVGAAFNGATVVVGDAIAKDWTYTITADDVLRGTIDAGVAVEFHGDVDGAANARASRADTIPTGIYVAPASTLDTSATYDDTNLDGLPSIGETVHVKVTVTNTGSYPLTGLTVADAAGSNVTGLLPVFPTTVAGGTSAAKSFDYVLTAADFARGSLTYATEMTATGLPITASSTSVNLRGITFQAYATDLDKVQPGGIQVCESTGTPTDTITLLSTILVTPGSTCTYAGLPYGYRVVAFSTPMLLGAHTFSVTVPAALQVGPHRLALYAPDGTLVGWKAVTAKDPIALAGPDTGGALASTGANGDQVVGLGGDALLLVLLGTAFLVADSRRRKHGAR
jgi:hypothetical protein